MLYRRLKPFERLNADDNDEIEAVNMNHRVSLGSSQDLVANSCIQAMALLVLGLTNVSACTRELKNEISVNHEGGEITIPLTYAVYERICGILNMQNWAGKVYKGATSITSLLFSSSIFRN